MKPIDGCVWDNVKKQLTVGRFAKVKDYLINNRIEKINKGEFKVHPSKGRHQIHEVNILMETCTCQFYNKTGRECSHIMAAKLYNSKMVNQNDEKI